MKINPQALAPVVLFTYNRLMHTKKVISSLNENSLCIFTDLIVFSDGPKEKKHESEVNKIRSYLKTIDGFKSVKIIERKKNIGLAESIIEGVSDVIDDYGKIIVLEDDIEVSKYFLEFMNQSLNFYEKKKKVWHINSWSLGINDIDINDYFFHSNVSCWGWGTWKDRWIHFKKNPEQIVSRWSMKQIYKFNLDGHQDYFKQIKLNYKNKINTWAAFWAASVFENKGLCLTPKAPFSRNIGFDATGTNCKYDDPWSPQAKLFDIPESYEFPEDLFEDFYAREQIKKYYRKNFFKKVQNKISSFFDNQSGR